MCDQLKDQNDTDPASLNSFYNPGYQYRRDHGQ